jgi:peptidyl-prolyl cis-trans isomerase C
MKREMGPRRCRPATILTWISALILLLAACRAQEPPPIADLPVATVNGEAIGRQEFGRRLGREAALTKGETALKANERESIKEEILRQIIEERMMLQRARELAIAVSAAELERRVAEIRRDYNEEGFSPLFGKGSISYDDWKEELRKRILLEKLVALDVYEKIRVSDEEAERYFNSNRRTYFTGRRVRAAQIVVREQEQAQEILKRLKKGEDFDKVAREVSIGPEAMQGGDLGFFERGVMPEEIDRIVFSLSVGALSRVVQSPYGFHIIKVLAKEEPGGRTFAEAKGRVAADLRKLKEAEVYAQWIEGLKANADIRINRPLPADPAPLPPPEEKPGEPSAKAQK